MTESAEQDPMSALPPEVIRDLHRRMVRIRLFEEAAGKLMEAGKMPGFLHLYVGQEAVAAGVMTTLRADDVITSTHRGHGHAVAKGADLRYMYAELFGKQTGYAEFTPQDRHMLLKDVADRAAAYGMPADIVDGMDAVAVYLAAQRLVERARAGEGPSLLEAKTYRFYDHQGVKGLRIPYRTQEEIDTWKQRDAITSLEQRMTSAGVATPPELEKVWSETGEEIAAAIRFAEESPDPDPAHLLDNVYTV